jgi:hypothetical protein
MGLQKHLRRPRQFIIAEIEASPVVIDNEELLSSAISAAFSWLTAIECSPHLGHKTLSRIESSPSSPSSGIKTGGE